MAVRLVSRPRLFFAILSTSVTRFAICARVNPSGKMIRIVGFAGTVEVVDVRRRRVVAPERLRDPERDPGHGREGDEHAHDHSEDAVLRLGPLGAVLYVGWALSHSR